MGKLLLDEKPLVIQPQVATLLGLNEAIVLQQIHYWLQRENIGKTHDGRRWMRNTYEEWQDNFPFWSTSTIRRTLNRLRELGVILVENLNHFGYDKTNWYTIDYEQLSRMSSESIQDEQPEVVKVDSQSIQDEQPEVVKVDSQSIQNEQPEVSNLDKPIPETSTENTTHDEKVKSEEGNISPARANFSALAEVCRIDLELITPTQRGKLNQVEGMLRTKKNACADDIQSFGEWWYNCWWKGKDNQPPRPEQVREDWGAFVDWQSSNGNGANKERLRIKV